MKISVLTLFPSMFTGSVTESILKRAQSEKHLELNFINMRDFATDTYKTVDDRPYGGGVGMILRVDVLYKALQSIVNLSSRAKRSDLIVEKEIASPLTRDRNDVLRTKVVLLTPTGPVYTQEKARQYAKLDHLILICGHYEGIDARIEQFIDEKLSIGQYILTGGEIPAMVVIDSVARLIPGVLKKSDAIILESFSQMVKGKHIAEHPQYTRPAEFMNHKVPDVLLSGNHKEIEKWKKKMSKTYKPK